MALSSSSGAGDAAPLDKDAQILTLSERLRKAVEEADALRMKQLPLEARAARYLKMLRFLVDHGDKPITAPGAMATLMEIKDALSPVPGEGEGKEGVEGPRWHADSCAGCAECIPGDPRPANLVSVRPEPRREEGVEDSTRGRFSRGWLAFDIGQPMSANPYPVGTTEFFDWQGGWQKAAQGPRPSECPTPGRDGERAAALEEASMACREYADIVANQPLLRATHFEIAMACSERVLALKRARS